MTEVIEQKKCNNCGETKELTEFYMRNGKPRLPCKACNDIASKAAKLRAAPKPPVTEGEKTCDRCGTTKHVTEFYAHKTSGNPWGHCIECAKAERREYYNTHKEEMNAANQAWEEANPEKVAQYKKDWAEKNPEKVRQAALDYYYRNQEKVNDAMVAWRAKNPEQAAFTRAKNRYGMTREQWDALPPHCEICGKTEGKFAVDHDHDTGAIRGKLCNGCNTGLAYFDEGSKSFRGKRDDIYLAARAYMSRAYGSELWA